MLTLAVGHVNADHIQFHKSPPVSVKPSKKAMDKELVKYNRELSQENKKYKDKCSARLG